MRRSALLAVVIAAGIAGAALAAAGGEPARTAAEDPVLAVAGGANGSNVVRVDPLTLRPVAGSPEHEIGEFHDAWAFSPDGSQVAFGLSAPGRKGRIGVRVLDRETLQVRGELEAGSAAQAVAWLGDDLIAALTVPAYTFVGGGPGSDDARETVHPEELILGRADGGPLLARRKFAAPERCPPATAPTVAGFTAVVLGERSGAPPRLVRLNAEGRYATVSLPGLPARGCVGLAAGGAGDRVVAVAAGAPLVEVDARSLAVKVHRLRVPATRACRRRAGCQPRRHAVWLGDERVAVGGAEQIGRLRPRPAGARVADLSGGSVRLLDRRALGVRRAGGALLTYGRGVRGFSLAGRPRWSALRGRRVDDLQVAGARAYARKGSRVDVLDARTGRALARIRASRYDDVLLLDPPSR